MALCQSQIRFSATDHRGGHFREESREKVTVFTSKSGDSGTLGKLEKNLVNLRFPSPCLCGGGPRLSWQGRARPRARRRDSHFAVGLGEFFLKNAPIAKCRHYAATWFLVSVSWSAEDTHFSAFQCIINENIFWVHFKCEHFILHLTQHFPSR